MDDVVIRTRKVGRPKLVRGICHIPGCKNIWRRNGKRGWKRVCYGHWFKLHPSLYQQQTKEARRLARRTRGLLRKPQCEQCGLTTKCELHRIVPWFKGGTYTEGNVLSLCPPCHWKAHPRTPHQRKSITT